MLKTFVLSSMLDMDILLVVCGITGISSLDYFCVKPFFDRSGSPRWARRFNGQNRT